MLSRALVGFIKYCVRMRWSVLALFAVLSAASIYAGVTRLDVTTDTSKMLSPKLDWKQRSDEMGRLFPQKENLMVAVIKADIPEEGQQSAKELAGILSKDHQHFSVINAPDDNQFLKQNGLMYLDTDQLSKIMDDTVAAQPFISALSQDPSSRGLFDALGMIAKGVQYGSTNLAAFHGPLAGFANALTHAASGDIQPLSWQKLLGGNLSDLAGQYQFVITKPILDYGSFQPGKEATKAMRDAINSLPFVQSGHVKINLTGQVKIDDEEFATVAHGMVEGVLGSLAMVSFWLFLAVRTWRVVLPIVMTLVVGLLLTTGFAALSVGTLNLISVAFAILFIGIAVDFSIQFSVRFRGQNPVHKGDQGILEALSCTGRETGHQILVAALATSAGFLAFTPTAFLGVAQLGLIAGIGMLVAFLCTTSLLPALLFIFKPTTNCPTMGYAFMTPFDKKIRQYRKPILCVFACLAIAGVLMIPKLQFDGDPLHTKNPNSEGMRTLELLLHNPQTSPYSAEILKPSLGDAQKEAKRLSDLKLPQIHDIIWLGSFVPENQQDKLDTISDAANLLIPTLDGSQKKSAPSVQQIRESAQKTADSLQRILPKLPPNEIELHKIQAALAILSKAPDNVLLHTNDALVRFLPDELNSLSTMLKAKPVTLRDIPSSISKDYVLPDGRSLVEIHPQTVRNNEYALRSFVKTIQKYEPHAAGTAVDIVESARSIVKAFEQASFSAIVMIAIILMAALYKIKDMPLVLAPLLLSALMTIILIVALPETLNFANIIALPLLLGVGVSFNIYFVMNWRDKIKYPLSSPTARAVMFSALTTGTAFGSLALSDHPGTASMGRLLLLSLFCTLIATLIFEPALLPKRTIDEK